MWLSTQAANRKVLCGKYGVLAYRENNVPAGSAVLADMPTSASIRAALPSMRLVLHPQYEDVEMRKRVNFVYFSFVQGEANLL